MSLFYQALLTLHATAGFVGLLAFWVPVTARKGGRVHRRSGEVFANAMLVAGAIAVVMTALLYLAPLQVKGATQLDSVQQQQVIAGAYRTAGILLPLGLLLLANVRQGLLVLKHKQDRTALRSIPQQLLILALALASLQLGYQAITAGGVLPWVFSFLGLGSAANMWRYTFKRETARGEWLKAHLGNMLGAGIGAHTAFFVFGGSSLLAQWVPGDMQLWFWIAPAVVGGIGIAVAGRIYAR